MQSATVSLVLGTHMWVELQNVLSPQFKASVNLESDPQPCPAAYVARTSGDTKYNGGSMVTPRQPLVDGELRALVPETDSLDLGW